MEILDLRNYFKKRKDGKDWRETKVSLETLEASVTFRNDKINYDLEFSFSDNDDKTLTCLGVTSWGLHEYREEGYLVCKYQLPFTSYDVACPRLSVELTEDMIDEFINNLP